MENGYEILWTEHALNELAETYEYLKLHFTNREIKKLSVEIDRVLKLISINPSLFPLSETRGVRRVMVKRFNTLYYRENKNAVEILSFFSNRQQPKKRKI